MVAGQFGHGGGVPALRRVTRLERLLEQRLVDPVVLDECVDLKRLEVDLEERRLHRGVVHLAVRFHEMPRVRRQTPRHFHGRNHAHVPLRVNHVGADQQLVRLAVDHPVRVRAAHGTEEGLAREVGADAVEVVAGTQRTMRTVRDHPQIARPRHHRARAALPLVVEHRQMRINSRYAW